MEWRCLAFNALSPAELYALLRVRAQVFVLEQQCVYLDPDGMDPHTWHLLGQSDGQLRAYARLLPPGLKHPDAMIGRVLTSPQARGQGLGRALVEQALRACHDLWPGQAVSISAQAHLQGFYASLGFVVTGPIYVEDGIAHIDMRRSA